MTLPNFLAIGAGRSGTTSLYHHLGQHPEVFMSPVKEPRYFGAGALPVPGHPSADLFAFLGADPGFRPDVA